MYTEKVAEETKFDWDAANRKHVARHEVAPAEAEQVLLNDPFDLRYEVVGGEDRWTAIGHTNDVRVPIVVWTVREDERIRVITARAAGNSARATYLRERGFRDEETDSPEVRLRGGRGEMVG